MTTKATCRAAALMAVLSSVPLAAAEPTTLVASTGLRSVLPPRAAAVTLSEVSATGDGSASVHLLLLDGRDRVLREVKGTVRRGQPLTLRVPRLAPVSLAAPGSLRAVARIRLTGDPVADLAAPVLTFETWNPAAIDDLVYEACPLPSGRPDSNGGNPVGDCGGSCHFEFDDEDRP